MNKFITIFLLLFTLPVSAENNKYISAINNIKNNISQQYGDNAGPGGDAEGTPAPFSVEHQPSNGGDNCVRSKYTKLIKQKSRIIFMRNDLSNVINKTKFRTKDLLSSLYNDASLLPKIKSIINNNKFNLTLLIKELIIYHKKIIDTNEWEVKLKQPLKKYQKFKMGALYHELGFPKPESMCYMMPSNAHFNNIRSYTDFDATLEAWLYSFWHRRHNEGTFDITHKILLWVLDDKKPNK